MLDLTVYLTGPTEAELAYLVDLYGRTCPSSRLVRYKIKELEYWPPIAEPDLTRSARQAAAEGIASPALEPVRRRIRTDRAFELRFWDGLEIEDTAGSWSFTCTRIKLRPSGLHTFVRFLAPLSTEPTVLVEVARSIARNVSFLSGHGGLVFAYHPWHKAIACDYIYSQARRFWAVDIEDLNASLPLMRRGIKCVSWITMIGQIAEIATDPQALRAEMSAPGRELITHAERYGHVVTAGAAPTAGDVNRPGPDLDPYVELARRLSPLLLSAHPDFEGVRFIETGSTIGWVRRFVEPEGWR